MIGLDIKAKLFFRAVETGDHKELNCKNSEEEFKHIYDLYFERKNDSLMKIVLKKRVKIAALENEIETVTIACDYILNMPLTDKQRQTIINELARQGYKIDKKRDLFDQINKLKKTKLGVKKNILNKEISELKSLASTNGKSTFDDIIAHFEAVLGKDYIPDNITLSRFISYENQIKERTKQ